jgi:hypothetical protein
MTDIANAVLAPVVIHGCLLRHKLRRITKEQRWIITPDSSLGFQIPLYISIHFRRHEIIVLISNLHSWYLDGSVPPLHPSCFEPGPFKSMVCRCLDVDPTSSLSNQALSMVWPRSVTISSKRADIASQDE